MFRSTIMALRWACRMTELCTMHDFSQEGVVLMSVSISLLRVLPLRPDTTCWCARRKEASRSASLFDFDCCIKRLQDGRALFNAWLPVNNSFCFCWY